LPRRTRATKPHKKLVSGDDAIDTAEADWFDFDGPAGALARNLYDVSKSSGVCCGILGPWGSGKSSFMKLMAQHAKQANSKVCITWFTAWDPGGIEDIGDAMLLRVFGDVAANNKDLTNSLKSLKEALGLRKSMRQRAGKALEIIGKATPQSARPVVGAAAGLLQELDTPRRVQDSFDELVKWLEEKDRTVFLFVDDIDRATGEQICDLLSELKIYVSHPRIVGVIGYDEDYVINALNAPVLPVGIDPRKFLEKIVTVRKSLPIPTREQLAICTEALLGSMLSLDTDKLKSLAYWATSLLPANPRRVKTLILTYSNILHSLKYKEFTEVPLLSSLLVCGAEQMGLLADANLREAFDRGNEEEIQSSLGEIRTKRPDKAQDVDMLSERVQDLSPHFVPGLVTELRLGLSSRWRQSEESPVLEQTHENAFDWSASLDTILPRAVSRGFTLGPSIAVGSAEVTVPANKVTSGLHDFDFFRETDDYIARRFGMRCRSRLGWKDRNVAVFVTSEFMARHAGIDSPGRGITAMVAHTFDTAPNLVADKAFILWLIDDAGIIRDSDVGHFVARAKEISKGLVHPFIFVYTQPSQVPALLSYMLDVCAGAKNTANTSNMPSTT